MEDAKEIESPKSLEWITYSMCAAALLALCNTTMSDLSSLGVEGLLYLSPGNLICGLMYCSVEHMVRSLNCEDALQESHKKKAKGHTAWIWDTVLFLTFTAVYLGTQLSIVLSFGYSQKAGVNEGIITSVWAITPLFGALLDYLMFGVKLSSKHLIGVFSLVACAALISLSSLVN